MSTTRLILSEIRFRSVNFLLCLAAVIIAATLFITGPTLLGGYAVDTQRELTALQAEADQLQADMEQKKKETEAILADMDKQTKRIMRDLGVNLRIVHRDTNLGNLYTDFVAVEFPEEYIQKLAAAEQIETIVHLIATLQQRIKWRERTALVVGTMPVTSKAQSSEGKQHMGVVVEPGTVYVGHELGVGLKEGETIEIEGQPFKIAQIMSEFGGLNNVQLVLDLHDAQKVLNKPGKINQIMALGCKCKGDRISVIRQQLEQVLPDTRITEDKPRAEAREKQRDLVEATRKQEEERVAASLAQVVVNRQRQEASRTRQQQMLARLINITTPLVILTFRAVCRADDGQQRARAPPGDRRAAGLGQKRGEHCRPVPGQSGALGTARRSCGLHAGLHLGAAGRANHVRPSRRPVSGQARVARRHRAGRSADHRPGQLHSCADGRGAGPGDRADGYLTRPAAATKEARLFRKSRASDRARVVRSLTPIQASPA